MRDRREVGRRGEQLAVEHLEKKGYRILERNVRSRYGEIDIVARDRDCTVFVEVRTLRSDIMAPEESVGRIKQRRIAVLAERYLQRLDALDSDWRADVVAIELDPAGKARRLEHIVNAVEER